jgi:DNA-binding NtrC family response regulator
VAALKPLPQAVAASGDSGEAFLSRFDNAPLKESVAECERTLILRCLESCDYNVKKTAETLGLERSHLYKKMRALGIDPSKRSAN